MNHLLILPILLPAIVAPLLAIVARNDIVLARVFSFAATLGLVAIGCLMVWTASDGQIRIYELGAWKAPYGIVLVLDRLSAIMVLLTACLATVVQLYSMAGWDTRGFHFYSLFHVQLMGVNGAFLTGDLFNLFVFFELLLIASYGLMVHGGGPARFKAGLQYISINLVGSVVFLMGLGTIYSVTGTLNMAHFAVRISQVPESDQALMAVGASLLLVVFGLKAALVPLHFWMPATYSNAPPPVAALFSIMSKVGVYALIRFCDLSLLQLGGPFAALGTQLLVPCAVLSLIVGAIGVLAARSLSQQASFVGLASIGTMLIAFGLFTPESQAAGLYYMLHSTLAVAALFLVVDLVIARRPGAGDGFDPKPFPQQGYLAALFFVGALMVIGLPPSSGFLGKLQILHSLRSTGEWPMLWGTILVASFAVLLGFAQAGSRVFWKSSAAHKGDPHDSGVGVGQMSHGNALSAKPLPLALPSAAIGLTWSLLILLTIFPGPVMSYLEATTEQLFDPQRYIDAVLKPAGEAGL
ncbi:MAG: monovalent cation/H+ antiporter subunit D [Pirellulaceae bacterium]|nr:monovalent cation/H+ antiporter subunit D [Pirellulaceae bacterium]